MLRFGAFEADLDAGELRKGGIRIALQPQPFQILVKLAERQGQVVSREDLRREIWGESTFVDFDHSLNTAITKLRERLGDQASRPRFIETLPKMGYRFVAPVEVVAGPDPKNATVRHRRIPVWGYAAGALIAGLLAAAAVYHGGQSAPSREIGSLAVLSFRNMTGDAAHDHLAFGLADGVAGRLAHIQNCRIVPPSSLALQRNQSDPITIGRRHGVGFVVDGRLFRRGGKYVADLHLLEVTTGHRIGMEEAEVDTQNVIVAETALAEALSRRIRSKLPAPQQEQVSHPLTASASAYDFYLRGKLNFSRSEFTKLNIARQFLEEAVRLDRDFADAHAWLALVLSSIYNVGRGDAATAERSRDEAWAALAIDQGNTVALRALIHLCHSSCRDLADRTASLRIAKKVIQSVQDNVPALQSAAQAYFLAGMPDRSSELLNRAIRLEPLNPDLRLQQATNFRFLGRFQDGVDVLKPAIAEAQIGAEELVELYYEMGRYSDAIRLAESVQSRYMTVTGFAYSWGRALIRTGRPGDARKIWLHEAQRMEGLATAVENPRALTRLTLIYALLGDRIAVQRYAARAEQSKLTGSVDQFFVGLAFARLGDRTQANRYLRQAIENGFLLIHYVDFFTRPASLGSDLLQTDEEYQRQRRELAARVAKLREEF